jgi:hypothetical protein
VREMGALDNLYADLAGFRALQTKKPPPPPPKPVPVPTNPPLPPPRPPDLGTTPTPSPSPSPTDPNQPMEPYDPFGPVPDQAQPTYSGPPLSPMEPYDPFPGATGQTGQGYQGRGYDPATVNALNDAFVANKLNEGPQGINPMTQNALTGAGLMPVPAGYATGAPMAAAAPGKTTYRLSPGYGEQTGPQPPGSYAAPDPSIAARAAAGWGGGPMAAAPGWAFTPSTMAGYANQQSGGLANLLASGAGASGNANMGYPAANPGIGAQGPSGTVSPWAGASPASVYGGSPFYSTLVNNVTGMSGTGGMSPMGGPYIVSQGRTYATRADGSVVY